MRDVIVTKAAAQKIATFFPWVYKNDILDKKSFLPGEVVNIVDENGRFLAKGYINLQSKITLRILSFKDENIEEAFFKKRILNALSLRKSIPSNAYRIVHSEADMLPGLIVDRYDRVLSIHFTTLGMLKFKEVIIKTLQEIEKPEGFYIVADEKMAKIEGFEPFVKEVGKVEPIFIEENGIKFYVDVKNAQKTGFYLDQRANRKIVANYMPLGGSMLDCFSNSGGFALYATLLKNAKVRAVDISERALEIARKNFEFNGVSGEFIRANVFDYLRSIRGKESFDMVVLDPPSFAKSKGQKAGALRGFKDIAVNGMKVVKKGGYLALFSCSSNVGMNDLQSVLLKAAKDNRKRVIVLEHLYQDKDHPIVLGIPHSLYLTGVLCQVFDI